MFFPLTPAAFGFLRSFTANISSGTVCVIERQGEEVCVGFGQMYVIIMGHVVNYPYANSQFFSSLLLLLLRLVRFSIKRICEIAWKKYNQNCFQMTYNCSPSGLDRVSNGKARRGEVRGGAASCRESRPSRNYAPGVLTVSQSASVSLDP